MLPLDESNAIGQRDDQFLRNIISTVLTIAVILYYQTFWALVDSSEG
jgi:hypothetical protein